jgi:hypothetical protein
MMNMQRENTELNSANQELSVDTVSNVVAGGTADVTSSDMLKKKRSTVGTGIAASLGINI